MTVAPHRLAGWTPMSVQFDAGAPAIRWCFTEGVQFTDPAFDQTIERCLADPFRLLFWRETDITALAELAAVSPGLEPAGFIFHMSRCGSTLVAQMLAGLESTLVISEAGPIDAMLRAGGGDRLRWIVSALGQRRRPAQTRLVIKLDAWAILQLPVIRSVFPHTPCVFIHRDPVEVVVSHLGHRGYHVIPGTLPPEWLELSADEAQSMSAERYCAAVLASLCEAAVAGADDGRLTPVRYDSLPEAVTDTVAPLFGIDVGAADRATLSDVAARDAKNPVLPFVADAYDKQRRASAAVRAAVQERVAPVYEALQRVAT